MESTSRLFNKNASERDIKKKLRALLGCTEPITIKKEPQKKTNTPKAFSLKTNNANIKLEKNTSGSNKSVKEVFRETEKPKLDTKQQKSATTNKSLIKSKEVKVEPKKKLAVTRKPQTLANSTATGDIKVKAPTTVEPKKPKSDTRKTKTPATGVVKAPAKVVTKKEKAGIEKSNTVTKTTGIIKATKKDKTLKSLNEKVNQKGKTNVKTKQELNTSNKKCELLKPLIKQKLEEILMKPSSTNNSKLKENVGTPKIKKEQKTIKSEVKPNLKRKTETKNVKITQKIQASKKSDAAEKKTKSKILTPKLENNKMNDSTDEILSKFAKLVKMSKSNKVILPNSLKKLAANDSCPIPAKTVKKMAPVTVKSCNATAKRNLNGKSQKKHLSKSNGLSAFSEVNPADSPSLDITFDDTENEIQEAHGSSFNSSWISCSTTSDSEATDHCDDCSSETCSEECSCSCSDCYSSDCDEEGEEGEDSEYDDEYSDWSTDSSDYCPPNDNLNVYIPKGSAITCDASIDCSKLFDSDAEEAQVFEISHNSTTCFPTKRVRAIKYHKPENTEAEFPVISDGLAVSVRNVLPVNPIVTVTDKMDIDDNDSCPELIPIDFDSDLYGFRKEISTSDSSYTYEDTSSSFTSDCSNLSIEKEPTSKKMDTKEHLPICQKPIKTSPTPSTTTNRFYNSINSNYVLALVKQSIFLYGTLKLKTIAGTVDIFGYTSRIDENVEIFSPKGYSSLEIRPKHNSKKTNMEKLNIDLLQQYENDFLLSDLKEIFSNFNSQTDAILHLERNDTDKKIVMIKKYMKENVFPNMNALSPVADSLSYASEIILRCVFNFQCQNGTKIDAKWKNIVVKNNSKLMIIGGKGVGKSTLLRYLVNTTLSNSNTKNILIIDLDIGQPELFIPQTISATVIDKPLLGPGYFHGYVPNKSYAFGSINVVLSPLTYLENVEELIKYCYEVKEFKNIPWIVNTMGYNKGFGSELIANITKLLKPTEIIQIEGQQEINNFDFIMNKETIDSIPNLMFEASNNDLKLEHRITILKSCLRRNSREWNMSPNDVRHTSLLSRFGTILDAGAEWLTDVKPVCTSISDLKLITFGEEKLEKDDLVNSIIGNFVYLCQKSENNNTFECYGIGIVRAVDMNQQKVYLLPSCSQDKLMHVNCLAICNIPLPTSISLNQGPKIKATVPYVYNTIEFNASKFTKQIYFRPETYFQGHCQPILE